MHIPGPPDAKRSIDARSRCRSTMKSRSSVTSTLFSVIAFRRIGSPFTMSDFLASGPSSLPSKIRGGVTLPSAIPIAAEQCASICATFILPHCRSPSCLRCATDWGTVLFWERRYDDAYKQLSKVIAMDAEFSEAYLWRGRVLLQQSKYPAAIADLETAHRINRASQIISPTLAYAYGVSGNRAKANLQLHRMLQESRHRYVSPWAIGLIYLGLGDKPRCLDWFEKAVRMHAPEMTAAWVAPEADPLRREPRFKELLSAMKLHG